MHPAQGILQPPLGLFVEDEVDPEELRQGVPRDVVDGRPEPTGGDQELRGSRFRCLEFGDNRFDIVRDHGEAGDVGSPVPHLPDQNGRVRVGLASEQFIADYQQLDPHSRLS